MSLLDILIARASSEWSVWFPGTQFTGVEPMLLAGGPAHRDRVSVLFFPLGKKAPEVIMKVGFTPREGEFLASEFQATSELRPLLPPRLQKLVPRALDLFRFGGATAVAAEVLEGERLLVSRLTGRVPPAALHVMDSFFKRSFEFSRGLAEATSSREERGVDDLVSVTRDFAEMFFSDNAEVAGRVRSFGKAVGTTEIRWRSAWQHQDVAVGNVLEHRGQLRFVDWEHAGPECEPWFDVAYAPVVTSHLASRVDRMPSLESAAIASLADDTSLGRVLKRRMEEVWDYPLPLSWGVTLTAMKSAMRRLDDGRAGSPEWADLVRMLLCEQEFRHRLDWLAPKW